MLLKSLIPELNLWFGNTILNNDLTWKYVDFPVKLTQKWRSRDSVIDLLFNECCDPSGNLYDGHHFITRYKTINLNRLFPFDENLYRRLEVIRNRCYVFACDDPNNSDLQSIFNLVTPTFVIDNGDINVDTIAQMANVTPSKYVTKYKSVIVTTSSDPLHRMLPDEEDYPEPGEPHAYSPGTDIFKFTEEELEMLEYLYYYRTGQFEMIHCFPCDFYYRLVSPLSKWIYLYLQCYLFNEINYEFLNTICDPSKHDQLRCMYEKHAQDRIYQYVTRRFYTIWNEIQDIGANELRRIFVDYTMPCHTFISRRRISDTNIKNGKITLEVTEENQPYTNKTFEFIYNGIILKQGVDYELINEGTLKDNHVVVKFNDITKFQIGTRYHLMWSGLKLSTPYNR